MGGTVGAQKVARVARCGGRHQRLPMLFALKYRQAIPVRSQPADKQRTTVVEQMMGGDGGSGGPTGLRHPLRRLLGGDVLQHHGQLGKVAAQGLQVTINKHRLTVKHIHLGVGDLAMDQQRHAYPLHGLQGRVHVTQVGHTGVAVGGGARGVELHGDHTRVFGASNVVGAGAVG